MVPCAPDSESYWESPQMVLEFSHFFMATVFPLHFLGAYCILKKTPSNMSSAKWTILNLHFWNTIFDCMLNIFIIPCLLFPSVSGFLLGVFTLIGVDIELQAWILVMVVSFVCVSTTMIFENRFFLLIARNSRWRLFRPFWMIGSFIFCFVYQLPAMMLYPDQELARVVVLESLPCVPEFLLTTKIIVPIMDKLVFLYSTIAFLTVVFGPLLFFTLQIIRKLSSDFGANMLSATTRRLQKNLLKALIIQTGIPFVYLLLPVGFSIFATFTNFYHPVCNNIVVVVASLHGCVSTSSMILIHHAYRRAVVGLFKKQTPSPSFPVFTRHQIDGSSMALQ